LTKGRAARDTGEMADPTRKDRSHFRGKPRPGRRVEVRYRVGDGGELAAFTKNIGVGGAFILTNDPAPPGSKLALSVRVPSAKDPVTVDAEVRWIVDGKHDEPEREHGMGVKFNGLDVEQLMALNEYFATLTDTVDHDEA
jgi:uncharacterized protein (TIGR02266 family)